MKRSSFRSLTAVMLAVLFLPFATLAHERQAFEIGDATYLFTVGSQNEPVVVDDRTGVSLRVMRADPDDIGNSSAPGTEPVTGLEETLRVIVSAEGQERDMDLSPAFRDPGAYETLFFPTKAASFSYTFVGEIDGTPVELSFTCMAGDHVMDGMEADESEVVLSENVTRVYQSGMFTCPQEKAPLGFPTDSASVTKLQDRIDEVAAMHTAMMEGAGSTEEKTKSYKDHLTFFVALAALLLSVFAVLRGRHGKPEEPTPRKNKQRTE